MQKQKNGWESESLSITEQAPVPGTRRSPSWWLREFVAYAHACDELSASVDEYYRQTLLGKGHPEALDAIMKVTAEKIWPHLAFSSPKLPDVSQDRFREEMGRRFGAVVNIGTTAGYYDLHMGHRIVNEERVIKQYGRQDPFHRSRFDDIQWISELGVG